MKKAFLLFSLCLALILLLSSCGKTFSVENTVEKDEYGYLFEDNEAAGSSEKPANADLAERKLIQTCELAVETSSFSKFMEQTEAKVKQAGGYIESSNQDHNNSISGAGLRSANLTIRVPADRLDAFTSAVSELATVVWQSSETQDVTLEYVDTQAHLNALRAEQESLTKMLANAETVSDIISIRDRLSNVQYEIESYESSLRKMENLVSYATVTISVDEVAREKVAAGKGIWSRIGGNLSDNFAAVGDFFVELFVLAVSALPFLLPFIIILFVVLLFAVILPRRRRKHAKRSDQQ